MLTQIRTNIDDRKSKTVKRFIIEARLARSFGLESRIEEILKSSYQEKACKKKRKK